MGGAPHTIYDSRCEPGDERTSEKEVIESILIEQFEERRRWRYLKAFVSGEPLPFNPKHATIIRIGVRIMAISVTINLIIYISACLAHYPVHSVVVVSPIITLLTVGLGALVR